MSAKDGVIKSLSVSQVEKFQRCASRWHFEDVQGFRPEPSPGQEVGTAGHALLERYFIAGELPGKRVKMGKAVSACIAKGELPKPGNGLVVEARFDGQQKRDAEGNWIPLDPSKTLWLGDLPWDGFVDLQWSSNPELVCIVDHKFTSDMERESPPLLKTVQMPVYAWNSLRYWPTAHLFYMGHNVVSKKGTESRYKPELFTLARVKARIAEIEQLVERMKEVAKAPDVKKVSYNLKACSDYSGCPHQSRCPHFKEKKMPLSDAEAALFAGLDDLAVDAPPGIKQTIAEVKESPAEWREVASKLVPGSPPASTAIVPEDTSFNFGANVAPAAIIPPDAPKNDANFNDKPAVLCADCGEALTPENSSKKRAGGVKHIGCKPLVATATAPAVFAEFINVKPAHVQIPDSSSATAPAVYQSAPPHLTIRVELGPDTLAILHALLGKLGK